MSRDCIRKCDECGCMTSDGVEICVQDINENIPDEDIPVYKYLLPDFSCTDCQEICFNMICAEKDIIYTVIDDDDIIENLLDKVNDVCHDVKRYYTRDIIRQEIRQDQIDAMMEERNLFTKKVQKRKEFLQKRKAKNDPQENDDNIKKICKEK